MFDLNMECEFIKYYWCIKYNSNNNGIIGYPWIAWMGLREKILTYSIYLNFNSPLSLSNNNQQHQLKHKHRLLNNIYKITLNNKHRFRNKDKLLSFKNKQKNPIIIHHSCIRTYNQRSFNSLFYITMVASLSTFLFFPLQISSKSSITKRLNLSSFRNIWYSTS